MKANPLRVWRQERNLTALDVALKVDLSEQSIYSFELGRFEPSSESIIKLADLMGLTEAEFRVRWHFWKVAKKQPGAN